MIKDELLKLADKDNVHVLALNELQTKLTALRCDHCKWWEDRGACRNKQMPIDLLVAPDFFCAYWEAK